jgi:MATE family multidrug resistance protein
VVLVIVLWQAPFVFDWFGIAADIKPIAVDYVRAISFGLPPMLAFFALRFTSEGIGVTRPIMYIALLALAINVFGNWLLIYGNWGLPRLGTVGCAVATAVSEWIMLFAMLIYMRRENTYRRFNLFARFDAPNWSVLRRLLTIGAPIGSSLLAEAGLFIVAAFFIGSMSATATSAHQIALNYASLMFMIPLAMCSATTIHVGHALGRGDRSGARRAGWVGIAMCGAVMCVSAGVIVAFNRSIAALYTNDIAVREIAVTLLLMAGIFQVSDGIQVGAAGALRGFKDTSLPLGITLFAYWVVGFPIAFVMGVQQSRGPVYVWVGLIAGLCVAAILLTTRYFYVSRRSVVAH